MTAQPLSRLYRLCSVRTASSVYSASISSENLISEVVMARMLILRSASALNGRGGDAGVAAHADADHRHLGDVGRAVEVVVADRGARLGEHVGRALVVGGTAP